MGGYILWHLANWPRSDSCRADNVPFIIPRMLRTTNRLANLSPAQEGVLTSTFISAIGTPSQEKEKLTSLLRWQEEETKGGRDKIAKPSWRNAQPSVVSNDLSLSGGSSVDSKKVHVKFNYSIYSAITIRNCFWAGMTQLLRVQINATNL